MLKHQEEDSRAQEKIAGNAETQQSDGRAKLGVQELKWILWIPHKHSSNNRQGKEIIIWAPFDGVC